MTKVDLAEFSDPLKNLRMSKPSAASKLRPMTTKAMLESQQGTPPADADNSAPDPVGDINVAPEFSSDALTWKKRYDDGKTYINNLNAKIKELEGKVKAFEEGQLQAALPKSPEELKVWREQHSDLYNTVLSTIGADKEEIAQELEDMRRKVKYEKVFQEVLKVHKDAVAIRESQEFIDWFNQASAGVKALVESDDANDVIRGIKLYKEEAGLSTQPSTRNVDSTMAVITKGAVAMPSSPKEWTAEEIKTLSKNPAQYAKYREEIKKARQEGRVRY